MRERQWMVRAGYFFSDDAGAEEENMEAFLLEVACELIGATEQTRGVRVVNLLRRRRRRGRTRRTSRSRRRSSILKST